MKIKQGKSLPIPECTLGGKRIIAARTADLLILDCYKDCVHVGRYMMNVETGEYGILRGDIYTAEKLMRALTGTTGIAVSRSIWKTGTKRSYKRRCGPR